MVPVHVWASSHSSKHALRPTIDAKLPLDVIVRMNGVCQVVVQRSLVITCNKIQMTRFSLIRGAIWFDFILTSVYFTTFIISHRQHGRKSEFRIAVKLFCVEFASSPCGFPTIAMIIFQE